ncbi:hypothetical protein EUGRSUZ_L00750 [Eucalyptus grandis]|uniref:Uncharacterized protein n=1 Tax=Eucalyptus grandis TaxID=71139 RepID=A0A058ZUQ4_EUCGR|nr:hypothetical protein EUGRSUZ_L00750 [Eucalyptus grandis]
MMLHSSKGNSNSYSIRDCCIYNQSFILKAGHFIAPEKSKHGEMGHECLTTLIIHQQIGSINLEVCISK